MAQKHHQMRIAMARFPLQKTLQGFDFKSQTSIDSKLVRELATGRYMRSGDTVISRAARNGERPFAILVAQARSVSVRICRPSRDPKRTNPTRRDRAAPGTTCSSSTMLSMVTPICSRVSSSSAPFPCHRLLAIICQSVTLSTNFEILPPLLHRISYSLDRKHPVRSGAPIAKRSRACLRRAEIQALSLTGCSSSI